MNTTDWLLENDPSLEKHSEGEWSGMVGSDKWSAFNDGGIECETGEFFYGLIRLIKPDQILETGTHKGIGASYMAKALLDNGSGHLRTVEFLPELYNEALTRIRTLNLEDYVTNVFGDVRSEQATDNFYDLILLDTEPDLRFGELVQFYRSLKPGGFVFIHDLHRHMSQEKVNDDHPPGWPFGEIPNWIKELVSVGELRPFHITTPRGFTGFYKTHPGDYRWPT